MRWGKRRVEKKEEEEQKEEEQTDKTREPLTEAREIYILVSFSIIVLLSDKPWRPLFTPFSLSLSPHSRARAQLAYTDLGPTQAKNFVGFLRSTCGKHASFVMPGRFDTDISFKVKHYAGVVEYDASAFIIKNRDELNEELGTLMMQSEVHF